MAPRLDAVVAGAGPAGSLAALLLAKAGATVALVDKAAFPRDKACGDLVGPRGLALLRRLGLDRGLRALEVGDMVVRGPTGGWALLPALSGRTYPAGAIAVPRLELDAALREAALAAGALEVRGRVAGVEGSPSPYTVRLDGAEPLIADAVVGADGATSAVATSAGLVEPRRVLWGFAVRAYLDAPAERPLIGFYEPVPGRGLPGYGWLFPGPDGRANLGVGVGTGPDRRAGAAAAGHLDGFVRHLRMLGELPPEARPGRLLGGWLKLGMVGTVPGRGGILLVGDAAGLVNPLQGEGIAHALRSGEAAAGAILSEPADPARPYLAWLRRGLSSRASAAALHALIVPRPRLVSVLGRSLTAEPVARRVAGAWGLFWNDLLDGAAPGPARTLATGVDLALRAASRPSAARRWLAWVLSDPGPR
jgi:geranylgeranyl reductase family protein